MDGAENHMDGKSNLNDVGLEDGNDLDSSPTKEIMRVIDFMTEPTESHHNRSQALTNGWNNGESHEGGHRPRDVRSLSSFCAHPVHLHSLTRLTNISTILRSRFNTCAVCSTNMSIVAAGEIVTCIACSKFFHRKCAQSNTRSVPVCVVNQGLMGDRLYYSNLQQQYSQAITSPSPEPTRAMGSNNNVNSARSRQRADEQIDSQSTHFQTTDGLLEAEIDESSVSDSDSDSDSKDVWLDSGPPTHWALSSPEVLKGIKSSTRKDGTHENSDRPRGGNMDSNENGGDEEQQWKSAFSNLSRVLQHNFFATQDGTHKTSQQQHKTGETSASSTDARNGEENCKQGDSSVPVVTNMSLSETDSKESELAIMENSKAVMQSVSQSMQDDDSPKARREDDGFADAKSSNVKHAVDRAPENEDIAAMLQEAKPNPPSPTKVQKTIQGTVNVVKKTNQTRKSMGVASIAGGIAGATAGLIVAGPAGIYAGMKIGQAAGVVGVLVEGSIGVGVLVAGVTGAVAGTVMKVNQLKGGEKRMLTIGENGSDCKVVLVRPNVVVDPIWAEITMTAQRSAPKNPMIFGQDHALKKGRQKRDKDIASSEEEEINTQEKVFLLVASSLNDRLSLPGYVYRKLIEEVKARAEDRKQTDIDQASNIAELSEVKVARARAVRQDVHGIIKHITATLLEVRPGFCSSPRITEMFATAVETLVFGELYDYVMTEIIAETGEKDKDLESKLTSLRSKAEAAGVQVDTHISKDALQSLKMLTSHHSVAEKLRCSVQILEHVSNEGSNANMGADCLLKLVCQHLALASVPNLNAECVFLEEFARDQQLLQGKEGYALVTLQASLHFLNASQKLVEDIFHEDD